MPSCPTSCNQHVAREDHPQNSCSVADLQRQLRAVAHQNRYIPLVAIDDHYGPETTQAVKAFQQAYGLPVTGVTDLPTWEALRQAVEAAQLTSEPHLPLQPFASPGAVLRPGELGDTVYILQAILQRLGREFANLHPPRVTGMYDASTERAVRELQQVGGLPATGRVDKATWNLLAGHYNSRASLLPPKPQGTLLERLFPTG